ncbi:hypothetical protein H0R92_13360 [Treponema sp. OMZ 840]|uniref:hypothetical protein n=1 Tax=Treponema sp. OMZ 840 TaxID=244313 RepID=UPI003D8AA954
MKKKIVLMCLCVSYTCFLCAQEKYDYTNINKLVDKIVNNSKTVEESIKNYGQPLSVRTTSAQDYAPNAFEDAVMLFHKYKNAEFLFFISEKNHKHFLMAWVITGDFAYFSPLLSNNMTINDVKKIFGENIAVPTEDGLLYGLDGGDVSFEFVDDYLVHISWLVEG